MSAASAKALRQKLETERNELLHELAHLQERTARKDLAEGGGSSSRHDDHMGELAGEHYEREKDLLSEANTRALLERVEKALAKVKAGTYGRCDLCAAPISAQRLEALPSAALCLDCQSLAEL